jgi:hypothetical protein
MQSRELPFTHDLDRMEQAIKSLGCEIREMGTKKYPNGRHWHIRRPNYIGTLELTWSPIDERMWLSWRANRMGGWIEPAVEELVKVNP